MDITSFANYSQDRQLFFLREKHIKVDMRKKDSESELGYQSLKPAELGKLTMVKLKL